MSFRSRRANDVWNFMELRYAIVVGKNSFNEKIPRALTPGREVFTALVEGRPCLLLEGPKANPNVVDKCQELGVSFPSRDTMIVNGTTYESSWGAEDYCLVHLSGEGTELFVMGTHRFGTTAGYFYLQHEVSAVTTLLLHWVDKNSNHIIELDEIEVVWSR